MTDQELLVQAATVPVMYFDGFAAFRKTNGVYRFVGYVEEQGAQLNIIMPMIGAENSNRASRRALDGQGDGIGHVHGVVLPH